MSGHHPYHELRAQIDARVAEMRIVTSNEENSIMAEVLATECESCQGSGLYIGWAEKDGAAVICSKCGGTGEYWMHYTPFTGRKERPEVVRRIWKKNTGWRITPDNSEGSMTLDEWKDNPDAINLPENAMQDKACPAVWYYDYPFDQCNKVMRFDHCPWWHSKEKCWQAYVPPAEREQ